MVDLEYWSWVVRLGSCDFHAFLLGLLTLDSCFHFSRLISHVSRLNILLRKEVIQPHLPIRLPCYDFTPITNPTFDGCLLFRLAHRLRVLSAFVV